MTRYTLKEICTELHSGKGISSREISDAGRYPVIGGNGVRGYTTKYNFSGECAVIGRQGAACGNVRFFSGDAYMTEHAVIARGSSICNSRYLAYALSQMHLGRLSAQSAQPGLSVKTLGRQLIELPAREEQEAIVDVLGKLDDKIALNKQINGYLLEAATARFEQALVNKRYAFKFSELVELEDSKRVPLNSRDRENRKGPYPYYGATSIMDYVDDYLFDGIRVLLGEDGTVIREDGRPVLQYVWGKYWVNNHAHILKAKADYSLEAIYIALARTTINHIVTGAVQMKISQKNLSNLELELPSQKSLDYLKDVFSLYRNNVEESKRLECLRDTLLPKLMSGEIDVSKVDLTQLNSHLSVC